MGNTTIYVGIRLLLSVLFKPSNWWLLTSFMTAQSLYKVLDKILFAFNQTQCFLKIHI